MAVNSPLNHPETTFTEIRLLNVSYAIFLLANAHLPLRILVNTSNLLRCNSWIPGSWQQSRNHIEPLCEM